MPSFKPSQVRSKATGWVTPIHRHRVSNPHRYGQKTRNFRSDAGTLFCFKPSQVRSKGAWCLANPILTRVSNPHRYGQKLAGGAEDPNCCQSFKPSQVRSKDGEGAIPRVPPQPFQTLTGTVKRYSRASSRLKKSPRFKPSQVRSKVGVSGSSGGGGTLFQTLTGTVKSLHLVGKVHDGIPVSNPHRYGQK